MNNDKFENLKQEFIHANEIRTRNHELVEDRYGEAVADIFEKLQSNEEVYYAVKMEPGLHYSIKYNNPKIDEGLWGISNTAFMDEKNNIYFKVNYDFLQEMVPVVFWDIEHIEEFPDYETCKIFCEVNN